MDNPLRQATAKVDVFVGDVNDNRPEFEYDMYNITVMENLPPGFTVLQVYAIDADKGENAEFKYILGDDGTGAFRIDENTGWISVLDPTKLDRENQARIEMKVAAVEKKPNVNPDVSKQTTSVTSVEINLLDANDNNPQFFPSNLYTFSVLETAPFNTVVGSVFAHDNDLAENGLVVYYKQNDTISQSVPFDVDPHNGSVYVLDSFPHLHKKLEYYTFFVVASDMARLHFERRTGVAVVRVNVTDINNSVPEFVGAPYEAYVGESQPEGAYVTQIQARDADSSSSALEYTIIAGNDEKLFIIDSRTGKIFTASVLDYERKQSYDLLVQVSDGINTAVTPLLVNVVDINDQVPVFAHNSYNFTVVEEFNANVTVGTVLALDRDSGKNSLVNYNIVGDHANDAFYVDTINGVLRTRRRLDRETESKIDFIVIAFDGGNPQLTGTTNVRVKIEDLNDNPPTFQQDMYKVEVAEEVQPPFDVLQVTAHDQDVDDNAVIKYLILAGNEDNAFNINPDTGMLATARKLNYEQKSEYVLHVAARNLRPFQGPHADNIVNPAVQVNVQLSHCPKFPTMQFNGSVLENSPPDTLVLSDLSIEDSEKFAGQNLSYQITEDNSNDNFYIDIRSVPGVYTNVSLRVKKPLDRDTMAKFLEGMYTLTVTASNQRCSASSRVKVLVADVNDNNPVFEQPNNVVRLQENTPVGHVVTRMMATDKDELDVDALRYLIVDGNEAEVFKMEENTGIVSVKVVPDREKSPAYVLRVVAIDQANNTGWSNLHIIILDENDWTPTFMNETFVMNVTEGPTSIGTRIRLPVVDYDDGINRQMEVYIIDGNGNGEFRLDVDEGGPLLSIVSELDREKYNVKDAALHFVFIAAKDKGIPARIGRTRVSEPFSNIVQHIAVRNKFAH